MNVEVIMLVIAVLVVTYTVFVDLVLVTFVLVD